MISGKKCKDIAGDIALSISNKFFNIIHIIFWIAMSFDNLRVILEDSNIKYEPIMKTLVANLSCDFKWTIAAYIATSLSCNFKIPTLVPIITIDVFLTIFLLMPKSSLEWWKWAEEKSPFNFKVYLIGVTVSSFHLIIENNTPFLILTM